MVVENCPAKPGGLMTTAQSPILQGIKRGQEVTLRFRTYGQMEQGQVFKVRVSSIAVSLTISRKRRKIWVATRSGGIPSPFRESVGPAEGLLETSTRTSGGQNALLSMTNISSIFLGRKMVRLAWHWCYL